MELNMSRTSRAFLEKNLPTVFTAGTLDDALLMLDAFITAEGMDENDDMTAFGHEAQAVYDDLYGGND